MVEPSGFLERFEEFIGASGWRTQPSPAELVSYWQDFVEVCVEGYSSTIYEFENERAVRDLLEEAFNDPNLRSFPELSSLRQSVYQIDEDFRRICRDDVAIGKDNAPWWRRCVPRRAQGDFADDLRSKYGIEPLRLG